MGACRGVCRGDMSVCVGTPRGWMPNLNFFIDHEVVASRFVVFLFSVVQDSFSDPCRFMFASLHLFFLFYFCFVLLCFVFLLILLLFLLLLLLLLYLYNGTLAKNRHELDVL